MGVVAKVSDGFAGTVRPGDVIVRVDPRYYRPAEVETLLGNPSKAKKVLGWSPEISTEELCREMVDADLLDATREVQRQNYES